MSDVCEELPRVICFHADKVAHLRETLPEDAVLRSTAERLKAVAHPGRLAVLALLAEEECCVCDLAHTLRQPISTASQHLRRLHRAGLLDSRQDGRLVFYSLSSEARRLLPILSDVGVLSDVGAKA